VLTRNGLLGGRGAEEAGGEKKYGEKHFGFRNAIREKHFKEHFGFRISDFEFKRVFRRAEWGEEHFE
jgi:hypothetical protein